MTRQPAHGDQRWKVVAGYLFYAIVLAAGYFQLGIIDPGTMLVDLAATQVSGVMAGFAVTVPFADRGRVGRGRKPPQRQV